MARKRSSFDSEQSIQADKLHAQWKRTRLSPSTTARNDSDVILPESVSEVSRMNSSPGATTHGQDSSVSSAPSNGLADDSDSSLESSDGSMTSTSGEAEKNDNESGSEPERVVTLGAPKKPKIDAAVLSGASDLASRLKAFLPQMQQANSELAEKGTGLNMEDVDGEAAHIEMSLGLGVLEQKKEGEMEVLLQRKAKSDVDDEQHAGSDSSDAGSDDESDVLDRLMNMEREGAKADQPSIEEVECRSNDGIAGPTPEALSEAYRNNLALRQSGNSRQS